MYSIRCHNRCRLVTIQNVKDGETGGFILTKTRVGCADARIKTDKNSQAWVQDSMLQTQSQGFIWGWKKGVMLPLMCVKKVELPIANEKGVEA